MARKIYLHIGLHKTGTTSIQKFLLENNQNLIKRNVIFYVGKHMPSFEISTPILRKLEDNGERTKKVWGNMSQKEIFEETKKELRQFLNDQKNKDVFISCEDISLIRTQQEINQLKALFPDDWQIIPILVLRNKNAWLNSFEKQLKSTGTKESNHPNSVAYFKPDSWLLKHETLVELLQENFQETVILQYQKNMVRLFADTFHLTDLDIQEFYLNQTSTKWIASILGFLPKPIKSIMKKTYLLFVR